MDLGLIFTIIGVILTVLFGVPVVIEWFRNRRRVQLSFVHESSVSLFKSYVKNIKNIEIYYHGNPIDHTIYALKGYIHNSGRTDIDDKMIHSPLSIALPAEAQWLEANIVGKSENVNVTYKVQDNRIEFQWDLLKPGELFCFETLYKSQGEDESKYKFEHRITNLGDVKIEQVSEFAKINKPKLYFKPLYPLIFMFVISLMDVYNLTKPKIVYSLDSSNYSVSGESLYTKDNKLYLETNDDRKIVFSRELIPNYHVSVDLKKTNITFKKVLEKFIGVIIVLVFSAFILSLGYYSERRKYLKATRFIETVSEKQS